MPEAPTPIFSVSFAHGQQLIPLFDIIQYLDIELPAELIDLDPENITDLQLQEVLRASQPEGSCQMDAQYFNISNLTTEQFQAIFQNYIPIINEYIPHNNKAFIEGDFVDLINDADPMGPFERFIWDAEENGASMGLLKNTTIELLQWFNNEGSIYHNMFTIETLRQFVDAEVPYASDAVYEVLCNVHNAHIAAIIDLPLNVENDIVAVLGSGIEEVDSE